jgi:hypothetical protein
MGASISSFRPSIWHHQKKLGIFPCIIYFFKNCSTVSSIKSWTSHVSCHVPGATLVEILYNIQYYIVHIVRGSAAVGKFGAPICRPSWIRSESCACYPLRHI